MNRCRILFMAVGMGLISSALAAEVVLEKVPEGGVQPQVVTVKDKPLLVYLKSTGDGRQWDVRCAQRDGNGWGTPVTVNSVPGSAVATGTIRGAQVAAGKEGSIHVVWNGPGGKRQPAPLLYSCSRDGGRTFQPQRDLKADSTALDGGASIAASMAGEVYVVWHGAMQGAQPGEQHRVVFVTKSTDNGATFATPRVANLDDAGVCACCSIRAFLAPGGELLVLYRAARQPGQRDLVLLRSRDGGATFTHRTLAPWAVNACPMSSASLVSTSEGVRAAWETEGRVYTALLEAGNALPQVLPGQGRHPALAVNAAGETLLAWSVGTGWQKGGDLAWQLLNARGEPQGAQGRQPGMPVWGMAAAFAEGGRFVVVY